MSIKFSQKISEQLDVTASGTSTMTTTSEAPVGQFLILAARSGIAFVVSSVSDSASNTWVKLANSDPLQTTMSVWYCVVTTALASSSTISITLDGATSGNRNMAVWAFDGITRPATTNTTARAANPSTTVSPANITPQQYGSLMFTAVGGNLNVSYTVSAGWTSLPIGTSSVFMGAAYTIRNSMDPLATTWTSGSGAALGAVAGTFTPDGGDMLAIF